MSLLKKMFSHGWLIALIVIVAVGYYFRADLFPGMFGIPPAAESVEAQQSSSEAEQQAQASDDPEQARAETEAETMGPVSAEAQPAPSQKPSQQASGDQTAERASQPSQQTATTPSEQERIPEPEPEANEATEETEAARAGEVGAEQPAKSTEPEPTGAAAQTAAKTPQERGAPQEEGEASQPRWLSGGRQPAVDESKYPPLREPRRPGSGDSEAETAQAPSINDARGAFWAGDYDRAAEIYAKLAELDSENPDVQGELGNVYYAQGKWDEAGAAYYEAAVRLVEQGRVAQAMHLQRILVGLDSERAEKLSEKLQEVKGNYR